MAQLRKRLCLVALSEHVFHFGLLENSSILINVVSSGASTVLLVFFANACLSSAFYGL